MKENDVLRERPDGMTIGKNGHLYLAIVNSSAVWEIDPEYVKIIMKNVEQKYIFEFFSVYRNKETPVVQLIKFPVPNIQSVAFGGPKLDILFVTTNNLPLNALTMTADHSQKLPADSGLLFMVKNLGVKGYTGRSARKSFASCAPEKKFFKHLF